MSPPIVQLDGLDQAMLLIVDQGGVLYQHQAGGTACMWPSATGYLLPLKSSARLERRLYEATFDLVGLSESDATKLDAIISSIPELLGAAVDRSALDESMEAWVLLRGGRGGTFLPEGSTGVLIWPNSD